MTLTNVKKKKKISIFIWNRSFRRKLMCEKKTPTEYADTINMLLGVLGGKKSQQRVERDGEIDVCSLRIALLDLLIVITDICSNVKE